MQQAESATNRKEAKKLINLATETMPKTKKAPAASSCYYSVDQLNDFLILQEQKLASAQAHVRTAEAMIELINQKKRELTE